MNREKEMLVIGQIWEEVRYKKQADGFWAADKHYPAGNALITARRLAEQGRKVSLAAALGDSEVSQEILQELVSAGVETEYLKRQKHRNIPQMAMLPETDAEGIWYKRSLTGEKTVTVPEGPDLMRIRLQTFGTVILEDLETWPEARYPDLEAFLKRAREKDCLILAGLGEGFTDETAVKLSEMLGKYLDVLLLHAGGSRTRLLEPVRRIRRDGVLKSHTCERKERICSAFDMAAERLLEDGAGAVVFDTGEEGRYGFYCRSRDGRLEKLFEEQHRMRTVNYCTQGTFTAYFAAAYSYRRFLKGASARAAAAARLAADSRKLYPRVEGLEPLEEAMEVLYEPVVRTRDEREIYEEDAAREPYPVNLLHAIGVKEEDPELFQAEKLTQDQQEGLLLCLGELNEEVSMYLDYRYRLRWSRENCRHFLGLSGEVQDQMMAKAMSHLRSQTCICRIMHGKNGNRLRNLQRTGNTLQPLKASDESLSVLKLPDGLFWKLKAEGIDTAMELARVLKTDPQRISRIHMIGKIRIGFLLQRLLTCGFITEEEMIASLDLLLKEDCKT